MSGMTDGQAAYEAFTAVRYAGALTTAWSSPTVAHKAWAAAAKAAQAPLRDAIAALIGELKTTAAATHPSKKSEIEFELKRKLEAILEGK